MAASSGRAGGEEAVVGVAVHPGTAEQQTDHDQRFYQGACAHICGSLRYQVYGIGTTNADGEYERRSVAYRLGYKCRGGDVCQQVTDEPRQARTQALEGARVARDRRDKRARGKGGRAGQTWVADWSAK